MNTSVNRIQVEENEIEQDINIRLINLASDDIELTRESSSTSATLKVSVLGGASESTPTRVMIK